MYMGGSIGDDMNEILFFLLEKSIEILKINPPNSNGKPMAEEVSVIFNILCKKYFDELRKSGDGGN